MTRLLAKSRTLLLLGCLLQLASQVTLAQNGLQKIGVDLYACISTNDASANSTFLVGKAAILLVDSGLNTAEAEKCLTQIQSISKLPIRYVVNTHYHLDHQGGNKLFAPAADIISTGWTRQRTIEMLKSVPPHFPSSVVPATVTFDRSLTVHLDPYTVEVIFAGPAHTLGDAYVYFPEQKAIATGDLFLNNSCPAMDQGSVKNWIATLNSFLDRPAETFVPGHFSIGRRSDVEFFRDYLVDLTAQVSALAAAGASIDEVKKDVKAGRFSQLRQYPKYDATISDNAASIYDQLRHPSP
jgi:cyclase